jgi:peptide/nickel transport system substrate-binding protein
MKRILFLIVLTTAVLALTACGGQGTTPASSGGGESQSSAASSEAQGSGSTTVLLDPALATDPAARDAISKIYESLVRWENDSIVEALAVDATASADQLDYIFTLRAGVSFHDGTPLNADAVITNFNRWFDASDSLHGSGAYDAWAANFGGFKGETTAEGEPKSNFDGIEKVDDLTVLVHLNAPDPDFLKKLTDPAFSIASPAALKAAGFGSESGTDGGSGAYKIGAWSGSNLTLEPNPSYWNSSAVPGSSMEVTLGQ